MRKVIKLGQEVRGAYTRKTSGNKKLILECFEKRWMLSEVTCYYGRTDLKSNMKRSLWASYGTFYNCNIY